MSQNRFNSSQNDIPNDELEISLQDILSFFKEAWKIIAITCILGVVASGLYLIITPAQYEAVTTIEMTRLITPNNALGANIEEPAALIARMSLPSSYNKGVFDSCGFEGDASMDSLFGRSISFAIPKGLISTIQLKVHRPTPELAKECAVSMRQYIVDSQHQALRSLMNASGQSTEARLATIKERLSQDKVLLVKAEQPGGPLTPTYFAVLSEIRQLEDEQLKLTAPLITVFNSLQSPIEVSQHSVRPKKAMSLVAGILGGLFFGLLIALALPMIRKVGSK